MQMRCPTSYPRTWRQVEIGEQRGGVRASDPAWEPEAEARPGRMLPFLAKTPGIPFSISFSNSETFWLSPSVSTVALALVGGQCHLWRACLRSLLAYDQPKKSKFLSLPSSKQSRGGCLLLQPTPRKQTHCPRYMYFFWLFLWPLPCPHV